jgi:hypothetical protein
MSAPTPTLLRRDLSWFFPIGLVIAFLLSGAAYFSLICNPAAAAEKVYLSWKFDRGRVLTFQSTSKISIRKTVNGKRSGPEIHYDVQRIITYQVRDLEADGTAHIRMGVTSCVLTARYGKSTVQYDSGRQKDRKKGTLSLVKPFAREVGRYYTFKINPTERRCTDFAAEKGAEKTDAAAENAMGLKLEAFREVLVQSTKICPAREVAPGDVWDVSYESPFYKKSSLRYDNIYRLVGFEYFKKRKCAKIAVKTQISILHQPDAPQPRYRMMESKGEGLIYFDNEKGFIAKHKRAERYSLAREFVTKEKGRIKVGEDRYFEDDFVLIKEEIRKEIIKRER